MRMHERARPAAFGRSVLAESAARARLIHCGSAYPATARPPTTRRKSRRRQGRVTKGKSIESLLDVRNTMRNLQAIRIIAAAAYSRKSNAFTGTERAGRMGCPAFEFESNQRPHPGGLTMKPH